MRQLKVDLAERSYPIMIGSLAEAAQELDNLCRGREVFCVCDGNTVKFAESLHKFMAAATRVTTVFFPAGENAKTMAVATYLCSEAAQARCTRNALFVACGGGVTGDLTGFAASIYMRGVDFIQVPTTLLAMVDSSVGGKTGVDLPEGKNLAGTFYQPQAVFIDPHFLQTLPSRQLIGAWAEIIKYGVIRDPEFFAMLERDMTCRRDSEAKMDFYSQVIERSCRIKSEIVSADERESGCRALLNYGHTFGHAIETESAFAVSHGEGVGIGMAMAGRLAVRLGMWSEADCARQNRLLAAAGLPLGIDGSLCPERLLAHMRGDKKNRDARITLVLPCAIGAARTVNSVSDGEIIETIAECILHD